jgi:hypothetical protein
MSLFDKIVGPSRKRFARLVTQGLREAGEMRPIDYEKDRFRLVVEGKPLPLSNFYREFCNAAAEGREAIVRRAVRTWRIDPSQAPVKFTIDGLLPVLWPRCFIELAALRRDSEELKAPWPHTIVSEHLAVGVAHPAPGGLRPLTEEDLGSLGLGFAEAQGLARRNLASRGEAEWRRSPEGYWRRDSRDGAASAALLLTEQITGLSMSGDPVAIAPQRDMLLVAGVDDAAALAAMAERAREEFDHPHAVSGFAFRLEEGAWRPWRPPQSHAAHKAMKLLQLESLARDYLQQQRLFDVLGRKAEAPLCLASFSAMEHPESGDPVSFLVWPEGLEILLPAADLVLFFQPDESGNGGEVVARVPWDRVLREAGDLMQPLDIYPPRYLVRDFPDADRLQAMMAEEAS